MNTATFIYYDNTGDRHEVPCIGAPTYHTAAKTVIVRTEEGEIYLEAEEITGCRTVFDI